MDGATTREPHRERLVVRIAEADDASGPFNLCCPQTPTNAEFTEALAQQLHRPSFATVPAFVLKRAAGRMAPELLGSLNVVPAALEASGDCGPMMSQGRNS